MFFSETFTRENFKKEVEWDGITILYSVVKDGLTEKLKYELRCEGGSKSKSKGKALQAEECLCKSRATTDVSED